MAFFLANDNLNWDIINNSNNIDMYYIVMYYFIVIRQYQFLPKLNEQEDCHEHFV